MSNRRAILSIPNQIQTHTSANCGPCSLKMVLDHFKIFNPQNKPYSVHACNRLLKTSSQYGVEESEFVRVLESFKLLFQKIAFGHIESEIKQSRPILTLYNDEDNQGHYALLIGFDANNFYFNDPWEVGKTYWPKKEFKERLQHFGNWIISVLGPSNK